MPLLYETAQPMVGGTLYLIQGRLVFNRKDKWENIYLSTSDPNYTHSVIRLPIMPIATSLLREQLSSNKKSNFQMIFKKPLDIVGYFITVNDVDIWVTEPEPTVDDDETTQRILTHERQSGITWGEPVHSPKFAL